MTLAFNLFSFLGRFHPLVVHLPIGFIILSFVCFFVGKLPRFQLLRPVVPFILFMSVLSGFISILFGFFLINEGHYIGNTLELHKWGAIVFTLGILLVWGMVTDFTLKNWRAWNLWKLTSDSSRNKQAGIGLFVLVLLISFTGHLGGELTHGKGYLEAKAPEWIQEIVGLDNESKIKEFHENPDSIILYSDLVKPILEAKCVACHSQKVPRGGLILSTFSGMQKGGNSGNSLVSGNAPGSELFQRVNLPVSHERFMPPSGVPLTFSEIRILEHWINNGLDTTEVITSTKISRSLKKVLEEVYQVSTSPKSFIELLKVDAAPPQAIEEVIAKGFKVKPIYSGSNLLDVVIRDSIQRDAITTLTSIKNQTVWLNLSKSGFTGDSLSILNDFENLVRLELDNNPLSDSAIMLLDGLENLETLNLSQTNITANALVSLRFPKLRTLYAWETKISLEESDSLQSKVGFQLITQAKLKVDTTLKQEK